MIYIQKRHIATYPGRNPSFILVPFGVSMRVRSRISMCVVIMTKPISVVHINYMGERETRDSVNTDNCSKTFKNINPRDWPG